MWVRSQDKRILGKFDVINISYEYPTQIIAWSAHIRENASNSATVLGEYRTEERAIEVLDDIQNFIACKGEIAITETLYGDIFQMPQV